ncbi:hypothetical protein [Shewanella sp. GXUN23E]|uniref:hypothetical protein n=1 Tax=Shewanella sp. GXUN23E TaxID=3422498 RepID=UPI003D7C8F87
MENIRLRVKVEGCSHSVDTDWLTISRTLTLRAVSSSELVGLHTQLCAGVRVTTRGLTLGRINPGSCLPQEPMDLPLTGLSRI